MTNTEMTFGLLARLAEKLGEAPIKGRLWTHKLDDDWFVAVNGDDKTRSVRDGVDVPPFHAYVEYCGWPAGLFNPSAGMFASGSEANLKTFCAAVHRALEGISQ